jgi:hypothetical protein
VSRFVCVDGDASCDTDSVAGQCTIEIAPCAAVDDSRLACSGSAPDHIAVQRLAPSGDAALSAALQASLDAVAQPATLPATCGAAVRVTVAAGKRATLRTRADAASRVDRDTVHLRCLAP